LALLPQVNDFFLWFYLAFAVSSTMMPSESDRHSWLPLGLWTAGLLALGIFAGVGAWMLENIAPLMNDFLGSVATIFGLSVVLHFVLLLPTMLLHHVVAKVTGVDVKDR
jgi:sorbitol-specific phosphotransferase system component IIBC